MSEHAVFRGSAGLSIERELPGTIDRVWQYLVDPELRKRWFCDGWVGDSSGQAIEFRFDQSRFGETPAPPQYADKSPVEFVGRIVEIEPPNLLVFDWPSENGTSSRVTVRLTARGDGTLLSLTHDRIAGADELLGAAAGWHAHLDVLAAEFDQSLTADFWQVHQEVEKVYRERLSGAQAEPMTDVQWESGQGKLGFLEPLLGRWETEIEDSPMGRVHCLRSYERILSGQFVRLVAQWEFGEGEKKYQEIAHYGVDRSGVPSFWSFTSDGGNSHGNMADVTQMHPDAKGFEAEMPAGMARFGFWPEGETMIWRAEVKTEEGWEKIQHHVCQRLA